MGQYHILVNMTNREVIHPHSLDCGLKAWEIIASDWRVCSALAGLVSHKPGNMPADLSNSRCTGGWAGHRILFVGDYAHDDDIQSFDGPPLAELYGLATSAEPAPNPPAKRDPKAFYDVSHELRGLLEQACSIRFLEKEHVYSNGDGWVDRTVVKVKPRARAGRDGLAHYTLDDPKGETLEWLKRIGIPVSKKPWDRAPGDLAWTNISDSDIDNGQTRVWLNLDRNEIVDPIAFGEVPTTAGIMRSPESSANAVAGMLFHPDRRGGGDFPDIEGYSGRWRNNRLVLTSEWGGDGLPSTEEAKKSCTDVSSTVLQGFRQAMEY